MLYCVSRALSVFCLVFVIDFVSFSLLLPTYWFAVAEFAFSEYIYDIDGCATTAVSLVSGWVFYFVTTCWIFLDQLM